jgi:hypothetical protein
MFVPLGVFPYEWPIVVFNLLGKNNTAKNTSTNWKLDRRGDGNSLVNYLGEYTQPILLYTVWAVIKIIWKFKKKKICFIKSTKGKTNAENPTPNKNINIKYVSFQKI